MKSGPTLILILATAGAACSSGPDRQWMKPGQYTLAEFRRDAAECTRNGALDDACMKARGWFAVRAETRGKREAPTYRAPGAR